MGTADGIVQGTTTILNNGSPAERYNIVVISDGYQAGEMAKFQNDAQSFVNALMATPPFDELRSAINVHRVNVTSTDSGADDPVACGGTGAAPKTFFDARFCGSAGVRRALVVNSGSVVNVVSGQVPQWHAILVIVNSAVYGGTGGTVGTFSLAQGANEIALHELGHSAFALADEYEYWQGCGVDADRDRSAGPEPVEANVTISNDRSTIEWADLIAPTTAMPTTKNADCTQCDPQPTPVPAGTVGAFEGARYYHCGIYRPEYNCKMRVLAQPFCAVCRRRIRQVLSPFLPWMPIVARHSGKCMDVAGVSTASGAEVLQWDSGGGPNQMFRVEPLGGGWSRLVAKHSGKVLGVAGSSVANGTGLIQWDWTGGQEQQFRVESVGDGYYKMTARHSGKVLAVAGASQTSGTHVIQWDWTGGQEQRWKLG